MNSKPRLLDAHAFAAKPPGGGACGFILRSKFLFSIACILPMLAACGKEASGVKTPPLTIYSPAPPAIMLHEHNVELGDVLNACHVPSSVIAMALPQSVNHIGEMDAAEKPYHLPIVTTIDFLPAVKQAGPAWHAYDKANPDLKFVASLYDVVFGVLAFDESIRSPDDLKGRKIGAPPQPSAVRVYTEALLRDGWGILDDVEIVDILPPDLPAAVAEGRIDATTWSLLSETADGYRPMMPPLLSIQGAHWIETGAAVAAAINASNEFQIAPSVLDQSAIVGAGGEGGGAVSLLSFKQALAAWEATPKQTVQALLSCIEKEAENSVSLPRDVNHMADWPGLTLDDLHAVARDFYERRNIVLDKQEAGD